MPAAKPSQASIANAVSALIAAGLQIGGVVVGADGSFRVEVATPADHVGNVDPAGEAGPKKYRQKK